MSDFDLHTHEQWLAVILHEDGCCDGLEVFADAVGTVGPAPEPRSQLQRIDEARPYSCGECAECRERGWHCNIAWRQPGEQLTLWQ